MCISSYFCFLQYVLMLNRFVDFDHLCRSWQLMELKTRDCQDLRCISLKGIVGLSYIRVSILLMCSCCLFCVMLSLSPLSSIRKANMGVTSLVCGRNMATPNTEG